MYKWEWKQLSNFELLEFWSHKKIEFILSQTISTETFSGKERAPKCSSPDKVTNPPTATAETTSVSDPNL